MTGLNRSRKRIENFYASKLSVHAKVPKNLIVIHTENHRLRKIRFNLQYFSDIFPVMGAKEVDAWFQV